MNELTRIFSHVSRFKVKSITDSLFKFGFLALAIGVTAAIFTDKNWVIIIVFSFAALFILLGAFFYCFFAIKKPDYLRSETYQLRKHAVELLGDNSRSQNKNLGKIHMIMNPYSNKNDDDEENLMLE